MDCFICEQNDDKVKNFTAVILNKCICILSIRKRRKLKYGNLSLSRESAASGEFGYHSVCYNKFAILKPDMQTELQKMVAANNNSSSIEVTEQNYASSDENAGHRVKGQGAEMDTDIEAQNRVDDTQFRQGSVALGEISDSATNQIESPDDSFVASESKQHSETTPEPSTSVTDVVHNRGQFPSTSLETPTNDLRPDTYMTDGVHDREQSPSTSSKTSTTDSRPHTASDGGLARQACVLCCAFENKVKNKRTYPTCPGEEIVCSIKKMADVLNDDKLLRRIDSVDSIVYHSSCYASFRAKFTRHAEHSKGDKTSSWHVTRECHKNAFEALCAFIYQEVIENQKVVFLVDLLSRYKSLLHEYDVDKDNIASYKADKLQEKILQKFGDVLMIETSCVPNQKRIVHKIDIDVDKLLNESILAETSSRMRNQEVAYALRNAVKNVKKKLPEKLKVEDIVKGECDIPDALFDFFCNLIQGPDLRRKNSNHDIIRIESICNDIIYMTTSGRIKPSKHLMLGLAVKSMTNSKKLLTTLNKLGHSIGYHNAEEYETELTFTAYEKNQLIPPGIIASEDLSTHVAFDNFDCFVDTLNGKDTLHDTVGIIYQFFNEDVPSPVASNSNESVNSVTEKGESDNGADYRVPRKRRKFDEIPRDIAQYCKKPTVHAPLLSFDTVSEMISECCMTQKSAMVRDRLWAIAFSQIPNTPMWIGFNCQITVDNSEMQTVQYLPQINESPTSESVVYETMIRSQQIAAECKQPRIIVTYDLAIAKVAMQLQDDHTPLFDNIFVNLGAFHLKMAYFKAIGKFIDSCGIADILTQTEVLAAGSINSFIECKHFNRCKRIHPLVSAALQSLHFDCFMFENAVDLETLKNDVDFVLRNPADHDEPLDLPPSLDQLLFKYQDFCLDTLNGKHGNTAQFYYMYIEFINRFLRLSRSIRLCDFELYVMTIFEMINLFFALNQPNYARYAVKYVSNMLKLKTENSELVTEFRRGAFGIKRTNKALARTDVDITLEQTINGDAANTLTGISHFTDSISARQKWAFSHSMRTTIISKLMEKIGISRRDDVTYELHNYRIEKDRSAVKKIIHLITVNLNPFDSSIATDQLFHITTGRASSKNVSDFLLAVDEKGQNFKKQFFVECEISPERFRKPIKRAKILNFSSDCLKKNQKSKDGSKVALIKMERDVFGRLLGIALHKQVDLKACLSYPLAPAPPALSNYDGTMHKTDKSVLAKKLQGGIDFSFPQKVDVDVVDGFYFLHLLGKEIPQTFEKISEMILLKLCNTDASKIHIVFDRYFPLSIKDCERDNREEFNMAYTIVGPKQKRPNDFVKNLRNRNFKEALVSFLGQSWGNNSVSSFLGNKKVYLTVEDKCFSFQTVNGRVLKNEETEFECAHEEADTRIIFHLSKLESGSKVVVKASDTDILIILLGNIHHLKELDIWMKSSCSKQKQGNYIYCSQLAQNLGEELCRALPAFHAFTGCDYTASFYRKGKSQPLKILRDCGNFISLFGSLNENTDLSSENLIAGIQEFTLRIYSIRKCKSVDQARYEIFEKLYCTKNLKDFMKTVKGFDSSTIPPCWRSLKQKLLRTVYVCSMWQNAIKKNCTFLEPTDYGWLVEDDKLKPLWYVGNPTPIAVEDILLLNEDDKGEKDDDDLNGNEGSNSESDFELDY